MFKFCLKIAALIFCISAFLTAKDAIANCQPLFFSVNDYGKEGPARDAQSMLDKYIEKWTAEKGIKKYKVGKKTVECKLFLDVIIFDEYTCTATANVCW